jgi:hypothetical protein
MTLDEFRAYLERRAASALDAAGFARQKAIDAREAKRPYDHYLSTEHVAMTRHRLYLELIDIIGRGEFPA